MGKGMKEGQGRQKSRKATRIQREQTLAACHRVHRLESTGEEWRGSLYLSSEKGGEERDMREDY